MYKYAGDITSSQYSLLRGLFLIIIMLEEREIELHDSILNKIIDAFHTFSQSTSKYENELKLVLLEMEEFKRSLNIPKRNGHYIDCVWSNPNCKCGPDTCLCCFRFCKPSYFINKLVKIMSVDYILWSLEEENKK